MICAGLDCILKNPDEHHSVLYLLSGNFRPQQQRMHVQIELTFSLYSKGYYLQSISLLLSPASLSATVSKASCLI